MSLESATGGDLTPYSNLIENTIVLGSQAFTNESNTIVFFLEGKECLKIRQNGEILVFGKLIKTDEEVAEEETLKLKDEN